MANIDSTISKWPEDLVAAYEAGNPFQAPVDMDLPVERIEAVAALLRDPRTPEGTPYRDLHEIACIAGCKLRHVVAIREAMARRLVELTAEAVIGEGMIEEG